MSDQDRTSAVGLARYARDYYEAAEASHALDDSAWPEALSEGEVSESLDYRTDTRDGMSGDKHARRAL